MASAEQIAADQSNSQQSSGPRTEAGKRISRMNSTIHGLTGQVILKSPAEDAAYLTYSARLMPDLAPANAIELDFAERIIYDSWRVRRTSAMEANLFALADAAFDTGNVERDDALNQAHAFQVNDRTFNLLSLYEQRLQRSILKNLAALKAMQKERKAEALKAVTSPKPVLQVIEKLVLSPAFDFVCSTPKPDPAPPPVVSSNDPQNLAA